jgi:hypothetical protein
MTQILELSPETAERLQTAARARGVSSDALAAQLLTEVVTYWAHRATGPSTGERPGESSSQSSSQTNGQQIETLNARPLSRWERIEEIQKNFSPLARQPYNAAELIEEARAGRMHESGA